MSSYVKGPYSRFNCYNHGPNYTHDTKDCRSMYVRHVNSVTVKPVIDLNELPDIVELSHLTKAN